MEAEKDLRYPSTSIRANALRRNRPVRPWGIAGHLVPFTEILETIGAPWRRSLSRAGLKTEYPDPTECIDAERGLRFCHHMAHVQGIPDLGFRAARRPAGPVLHPRLARRLTEADTLVQALCAFRELGHLQSSGLRVWLRATPTINEFTGDRIRHVFEVLAPVLVTGRTEDREGLRIVSGVDAADFQ